MGSAFVGAADDATAAFVCPAGLGFLATPEISIEARVRRTETPFLAGGRLSGTATGIGLDTAAGPVYKTDVDSVLSPAFASVLLPLTRLIGHLPPGNPGTANAPAPLRDRVSVAVFRHQVATISNSFFSQGAFERGSFAGETDDRTRDLPLGGTRQVRIASYGGAIGVDTNGMVSVGASLSAYTIALSSSFARYGFTSNVFSAADTSFVLSTATQDANDISVGGSVGVLWRSAPTAIPTLKLGGTFRKGPAFRFAQVDQIVGSSELRRTGRFKVPDVLAVGAEWHVTKTFRVAADWDFVRYSELKRDFINFQSISSARERQLRLDDGHEIHGGVEYMALNVLPVPLAIRTGAWLDPDHAVRYEPTEARDELDIRLTAALPGGHRVIHYAVGAGTVLGRFELNGGADLSSRSRYGTISAVVRF
jgi:hypothetical protein